MGLDPGGFARPPQQKHRSLNSALRNLVLEDGPARVTRPFPYRWAWLLDNPVRALLLSPRTLIDRLPLLPHHSVLEVGPGSGFYSLELARRVPDGHLQLLDVQDEMLAEARRKLTRHGITNAGFSVADAGLPLPFLPERFDLALLVAVLGEIPDPGTGVEVLATVLKPGGIFGGSRTRAGSRSHPIPSTARAG